MKMKILLGTIALLFTAMVVNAQDQTVTLGSTHQYHVTDHSASGYAYLWSITAPVAGNTIETPANASTNILWGTPGTYTITLAETNSAGSCATPNTFTVLVLGGSHLQFNSNNSASCAGIAQDLTLSFTDANGTVPALIYYPLIINYTVDGGATQTATINFGEPLVISLTINERADKDAFANYDIPVVITSATSNGGSVILDANTTNTNTVYDTPELNPIIQD